MVIIEFFGLPYSGKSYNKDFLLKKINSKNTYNYNTIFIKYLFIKKKISFFEYLSIKHYLDNKSEIKKKNNNNMQKNKFSILNKLKKKIFNKYNNKIYLEKARYFKEIKKNYADFISEFKKINSNQPIFRKKKLNRWILDQIVGHHIAKNNLTKGLLINSEGFAQRVLSLNIYETELDDKKNDKILSLMPKSDFFIYINEDIKFIKDRIKNYKLENSVYIKKIDKLQIIVNQVENYLKKKNLFLLYKNNFYEYLKENLFKS